MHLPVHSKDDGLRALCVLQVQTERGDMLNMRSKELQLLQDGDRRISPDLRLMDPLSAKPCQPPVRTGPPPAPRQRNPSDIVIGNAVVVHRPGPDYGHLGKVVDARNGYLVVQLPSSKLSYFRSRDVQRSRGGKEQALPPMPLVASSSGRVGGGRLAALATKNAAKIGGGHRMVKAERISWRANNPNQEEEEPDETVAPHEHEYRTRFFSDLNPLPCIPLHRPCVDQSLSLTHCPPLHSLASCHHHAAGLVLCRPCAQDVAQGDARGAQACRDAARALPAGAPCASCTARF